MSDNLKPVEITIIGWFGESYYPIHISHSELQLLRDFITHLDLKNRRHSTLSLKLEDREETIKKLEAIIVKYVGPPHSYITDGGEEKDE